MAMNNNKNQDEILSEINMTPLIDIMLVLLIIFMVTSSAALQSGLDVQVPEVSAVTDKQPQVLIVSLAKDGKIAVAGQVVSPEELAMAIRTELEKLPVKAVILEGDGQAPLAEIMRIMDLAKANGATEFSIAASEKSQQQ
jgi:biopolymer transport protein ExbD